MVNLVSNLVKKLLGQQVKDAWEHSLADDNTPMKTITVAKRAQEQIKAPQGIFSKSQPPSVPVQPNVEATPSYTSSRSHH